MQKQSAALQPHRRLFADRKRNPDGKRGAVLHTAVRMFLERSYGRTSMNDVAMQLNITKPALYHYFRNKEEILVEICQGAVATLLDTIQSVASLPIAPVVRLRMMLDAYMRFGLDNPNAYKLIYRSGHNVRQAIDVLRDEVASDAGRHLLAFLEAPSERGILK